MDDESDTSARLDRLEESQAHLAATVDDLNDMITRQWQTLDALTRDLRRLQDRLARLEEDRDRGQAPPDPPPPHY
ncbi:MAG: SlyX family protein [Hyphomicrobiales bacterium]|nr:SlyX family protein [Hyphomicrobiales bacterium]MCP5373991.1 SlyX family protein [Hyphomicrobiales bacterium]